MNFIFQGVTGILLLVTGIRSFASPGPDDPFTQAISVKYTLQESLKGSALKKVVSDYNDNIYVLADRGVFMVCDRQIVKDIRYTPLAGKVPADIAIQEQSGHLYYLYDDHFLSNAYAGKPFGKLPDKKYNLIAVAADGTVLLANENSAGQYQSGELKQLGGKAENIISLHCYKGEFYAFGKNDIYKIENSRIESFHHGNDFKDIAFRNDEIIVGTTQGYYGINRSSGKTVFPLKTKIPVQEINALLAVNGNIWAATPLGGFMQDRSGGFRYYASRRWLDDDKIKDIASDSKGNIYYLTATGVNEIRFTSQTLAKKTEYFQHKIRERHIRYGFISNVTFKNPGDISTAQMTDTDNDGLWSAFYLGSQAFRYAVTKEKQAKRYAWEAFEAFERILSINPLKGFPARTFERKGFKHSDPSRWHESPESGWEWKGTTSSDEFVGYIWVAAVMNEMVAETKEEKQRIADFIDKILTHIIDNDYYFVDADGKPTLWGRWNPEYINSFPETVGDRRLGSTTIVAGLQLAYSLTGKEKFKTEAFKLMNDFGYLRNIQLPYTNIQSTPGVKHQGIDLGDGGWNHSDDEMAFLTYWVLHNYAFNDQLKQKFDAAIHDHWQIEKPEKNAVWNLIALGTTGDIDTPSTLWHLREFPMDLVRWNVRNSHRKDIELLPPNFRNQTTKELLPPGEKPVHRHNTNAFILDGGENGMSELAGDEYLLPYWMARYLKVIQ